MNSTEKGDQLEVKFYEYLLDQKRRGELVYGLNPAENCNIYIKKGYYCNERKADIQFDVVVEVYRAGSTIPFLYIVFECKNYEGSVPESCVSEFSDKLSRVFRHAAKGVLVVNSHLQSGAVNLARSRSMGIVKYDEAGLEVVADRSGRNCLENRFVRSQIFRNERPVKSLKFSAFHDGRFFGTISQFLCSLEPGLSVDNEIEESTARIPVPYLPAELIEESVQEVLEKVGYEAGPVDLEKICSMLSIDLRFSNESIEDEDGTPILGSANFDRRSIHINPHTNKNRERFTLGHEIGHFCLKHDRYLRSEIVLERDLFLDVDTRTAFNYERLELQANMFASGIILPKSIFIAAVEAARIKFDFRDRGHGYVFVDDQPCNSIPYNQLLSTLSSYFKVSKQAIELKMNKMGLLNDQRKRNQVPLTDKYLEGVIASFRQR